MKNYIKIYCFLVLSLFLLNLVACEKFLDEKPKASLAVPETLKDFQALIDQTNVINDYDASAGEVSANETYLTDADYLSRTETDKRMYTWQNDNVFLPLDNDWNYLYRMIYVANTVIENIKKVEQNPLNTVTWRNTLGQAYFIRARAHLQVIGLWANTYDETTANTDLGIPLKLSVNFNEVSKRNTVQQGYEQIISDLQEAIAYLSVTPVHVVRASKPAAYGLLARTYLWMRKYDKAVLYADSCLQLKSDLIDFNVLTASATFPIAQFNTEVIAHSRLNSLSPLVASRAKINLELYQSYDVKDLRKIVYFKDNTNGTFAFKGSYDGSSIPFSGVATDEMFLTRAECYARLNRVTEAMKDLNTLLRKRYKTGQFVDYNLTDANLALQLILKERRKELLLRGLRWPDIKRLNKEGANISLSRTVNGNVYSLPASNARFSMPIPEDVINLSGMPQNNY